MTVFAIANRPDLLDPAILVDRGLAPPAGAAVIIMGNGSHDKLFTVPTVVDWNVAGIDGKFKLVLKKAKYGVQHLFATREFLRFKLFCYSELPGRNGDLVDQEPLIRPPRSEILFPSQPMSLVFGSRCVRFEYDLVG